MVGRPGRWGGPCWLDGRGWARRRLGPLGDAIDGAGSQRQQPALEPTTAKLSHLKQTGRVGEGEEVDVEGPKRGEDETAHQTSLSTLAGAAGQARASCRSAAATGELSYGQRRCRLAPCVGRQSGVYQRRHGAHESSETSAHQGAQVGRLRGADQGNQAGPGDRGAGERGAARRLVAGPPHEFARLHFCASGSADGASSWARKATMGSKAMGDSSQGSTRKDGREGEESADEGGRARKRSSTAGGGDPSAGSRQAKGERAQ